MPPRVRYVLIAKDEGVTLKRREVKNSGYLDTYLPSKDVTFGSVREAADEAVYNADELGINIYNIEVTDLRGTTP